MVEDKDIGKGLLYKIEELIKTGKIKEYRPASMEDYKRFCKENDLDE